MKKRIALWLAAALALCLTACQTPGAEPSATPTPTETASPVAEVTPTPAETIPPSPEPTHTDFWPYVWVHLNDLDLSSYEGELSGEEWEALQGFFPVLNNEVPMLAACLSDIVTPTEEVFFRDIYQAYVPQMDIPAERQSVSAFALAPVTGENLDLAFSFKTLGNWYLLIHREGEQFYAVYMPVRWFHLQGNGLYVGSGSAATHYCYRLHFAEGTFTAELLANTDWGEQDEEGRFLGYFAIGGEEVTEAEFEAWSEENLSGDAIWHPVREKGEAATLGAELSLTSWQAAYADILLHPEEYAEFYTVAEHIPSENAERLNWIIENNDLYYFAISDLNGDEIPELLLGQGIRYEAPGALLNILCWNEEMGVVEDLDGPRTYPLMDTFYFYDTGYFSTMNGAGGLYTEFWHLEDKDPDHYWYGYERSATFNEDGELVSWVEFPFESSDGEKFTLQEYYELLGETGVRVLWQEITEENIRQAFLPTVGEEATP